MTRIGSIKRLAVLAIGLSLLAAPVRAQKIMGTVEMESWSGFTSNLSAFCQSAGLPFALAGLNGMTRQIFKSSDLSGIDLARPVRLYLLQPAISTNGIIRPPLGVLALPVIGDGHGYLDRLGSAYAKTSQVGAVHLYSAPVDRRNGSRKLAAQVLKDVVLLGDSADDVAAAAGVLQAGPAPASPRVVGDVRVSLDMTAWLPMVEQGFAKTRREMARMPPPAMPGAPTNMTAVLDAEMDGAMSVLRQTQSVALGFKASDQDSTIYLRVDAVPGTTLAAALACLKPADARYASILPSNTLYGTVGGGLDALHVVAKPYMAFVQRVYQAMPGMENMVGPMRELMMKSADLYTGDYAIGLLPDARNNGLLLAEVFSIADAERGRALMREGLAMASKMNPQDVMGMGMKIDIQPSRSYAGTDVSAYRYQFSPSTNQAAANAAGMPQPGAMFMGVMTGLLASCTLETAIVDNNSIVTLGRAGAIEQVIDRVRGGGDSAFVKRAQAVFGDVQTPPVEIGHLALVATLERVAQNVSTLAPAQLAALPEPGEGIGFTAFHQGTTWIGALRLTSSELKALVRLAPVAQGIFMGAMPHGGAQPGAGHDDDEQPAPMPAPGKAQF